MTVPVTFSTAQNYVGSGAAQGFSPGFTANVEDQVVVYEDGVLLTNGSDYDLLGLGDMTTGITVQGTFVNGATVLVARVSPQTQTLDVRNNTTLLEDVIEQGLDYQTMVVQELQRQLHGTFRVPLGEALAELPAADDRADTVPYFDAFGTLSLLDSTALSTWLSAAMSIALGQSFKGDPGGNAMAIGLFTALGGLSIPVGTDLLQTSGYAAVGRGGALYVYDVAIDAAYVAANPLTSKLSSNGRGFKLYADQVLNALMFGANGTDALTDQLAFEAAFAYTKFLYVPEGVFTAIELHPPEGMTIVTAGAKTIFQQKGAPDNTRLINIGESFITWGTCTVSGEPTVNAGEQNHGFFISAGKDIHTITLGDIYGKDLRGDALCVTMTGGFNVRGGSAGNVYAYNCYRNGVSLVDGIHGFKIESIIEDTVKGAGHAILDIELDSANSSYGMHIGFVRGRKAVASGQTGFVQVHLGSMRLDDSYGAPSDPVYAPGVQDEGFVYRGAIISAGSIIISNQNHAPLIQAAGGFMRSVLNVDHMELVDTYKLEVGNIGYLTTDSINRIGHLKVEARAATHHATNALRDTWIGTLEYGGYNGSNAINSPAGSVVVDNLIQTISTVVGAGSGGNVVGGAAGGVAVNGGIVTGLHLTSFSNGISFRNIVATLAGATEVGDATLNEYHNLTVNGALRNYTNYPAATVTQITSKSTGVTQNAIGGIVVMHNENMAADVVKSFFITNSTSKYGQMCSLQQLAGTDGAYHHQATAFDGNIKVTIKNISAGALAEAVQWRYRLT